MAGRTRDIMRVCAVDHISVSRVTLSIPACTLFLCAFELRSGRFRIPQMVSDISMYLRLHGPSFHVHCFGAMFDTTGALPVAQSFSIGLFSSFLHCMYQSDLFPCVCVFVCVRNVCNVYCAPCESRSNKPRMERRLQAAD